MDYDLEALSRHKYYSGKIGMYNKIPIENREDLGIAYTPGVAAPCREIYNNQEKVYEYTAKSRMIAVISDGSAVLGLGNIGAGAAIPVMEGKAALFKRFGNVDAVPICLDTQDADEIIRTVKNIAPCFGGINLEDISSPRCFRIEKQLEEELDIPVFHDDQHGTAIVVTAALLNALRLTGKVLKDIKVVVNGPGAAGTAIIKMLLTVGAGHILACDEYGILHQDRESGITDHKRELCDMTNEEQLKGTLKDALKGADVFIGVSKAGVLEPGLIRYMADGPIVFAMANPVPEISYEDARKAGVRIIGTGRSDYPNQINNVLAFPGIFKGALSVRARNITSSMKTAAAVAIASCIPEGKLREDYVIPGIFDPMVTETVARSVAEAWRKEEEDGYDRITK